jgi:Flp pilus assembly protein TadD
MSDIHKLYDEADQLKTKGDNAGALEKLQAALAIDPNYALGYAASAVVLQRLGRQEEAIAAANKVCELEPNDPFSYTALSVTCQRAYAATGEMHYIPMAEDAMAHSRNLQMGMGR